MIIAIVWVQVPSSALNNKTGTKQNVWSLSCCSKPKRALNSWFKVSPPARSARGMRSPGPHSPHLPQGYGRCVAGAHGSKVSASVGAEQTSSRCLAVSALLLSLQNRRPPDVLQPIFHKALVVVAKLYGFRSKLHIRSEGEDKLMSQKKYSLLYPDTNAQYRTLSDMTMHDLGMDQICKKLSAKEREQNYIQNVMARLYADPAVTQYRCDIFEDILQQKKMRDDLMEILERISFLREYGSFNREYDESACIWDLLHRLDELNDYIKCVDALHTCLAASDIHSAGFLGLKAYVEKIYADNGFAELKKDISELKMDTSQLKSITVGINLNDRFEADGIGLISVNSKYFTKSGILGNFYDHIASKDRINEDTIWKKNFKFQPFDVNADAVISTPKQKVMDTAVIRSESRGGIVKLPEGDQAKDVTRYTDRIVNHMISHMVKRVREVLNKYVSITITDMTDLIPELLYYIKWAEYIQKLQEQGFTFAKASVYKE